MTSNPKGIAQISQQQEAYIDGIAEEFELKDKKRGRHGLDCHRNAKETWQEHNKQTTKLKNRPYCHECNGHKQQFDTEEKAMLHIRFNSDTILRENGYAPIRSYYCKSCCCWHITSKEQLPFPEQPQQPTDKYIDKLFKAEIRLTIKWIKERLHEINRYFSREKAFDAEHQLYYKSIFQDVMDEFNSIAASVTKRQSASVLRRICLVQPHFE